jgi:hypothetical protein
LRCSPVIIIGAPRSGTNMLRDMLTELPGVGTWPCDEINYIWRHGNVWEPSDELLPQNATFEVRDYVRRQFENIARKQNVQTVVEKTCANSLRLGFVDQILPESKYIFIVRDGIDVVGSATKRWKAALDIPYLVRKARYVPGLDLPFYAIRYLYHRMYRFASKEKRLAFWGPKFIGVDDLFQDHSLIEVCALQWKACVENTERDLSKIAPDRLIRVSYERLVGNPSLEFARISEFLNKKVTPSMDEYLRLNVRSDSIGKGREFLGETEVERIGSLLGDTLVRYGYEV